MAVTSDIVNQISAYAAKQKRQAHRRQDNAPTPERVAKSAMGMVYREVRPGERTHAVKSPVDALHKDFSADEYEALRRYAEGYMLAERSFGVMDYTGASSRGSGSKLGGYGNISEAVRTRITEFSLMQRRICPFFRDVLEALVAQVQSVQLGKALSPQEYARQITHRRDKATLQGMGIALLKAAAHRWMEEERRERALTKQPPLSAEEIARRRAERMERVRG